MQRMLKISHFFLFCSNLNLHLNTIFYAKLAVLINDELSIEIARKYFQNCTKSSLHSRYARDCLGDKYLTSINTSFLTCKIEIIIIIKVNQLINMKPLSILPGTQQVLDSRQTVSFLLYIRQSTYAHIIKGYKNIMQHI